MAVTESKSRALVENLNTLGACISLDAATFAELPRKFDLTFDIVT
jgi:hypothetical protein